MTTPVIDMKDATIVQGASLYVNWNLVDNNGDAVDMTDSNKTLYMELQGLGAISSTTYERLSTTSTHNNYTATGRSQSGGKGQWTFGANESFTEGEYKAVCYLKDTADAVGTPVEVGSAHYTVVAPETNVP